MHQDEVRTGLGKYVRRLRATAGLGLRELGRVAGLNATWIMRVEQGRYANPDPKRLAALARALEVEVTDLYAAAGYPAELPAMQPYLRTRYGYLPDEAIDQLEAHFDLINEKYHAELEGEDHVRNRH